MKTDTNSSLKKLIWSILLNTVIIIIALFVFKPFFEEIDDTNIAMIAEGAFGERFWQIINSNTLLGKLLVFLQTIAPSVRWFVIIQYILIYAGYVSLVYILSDKVKGMILSSLAVVATFYEMYVSLQYTKTAAFLCATGYIILFKYIRSNSLKEGKDTLAESIQKGKKKLAGKYYILGLLFVAAGILIRHEGILFASVPAVAVGILELIKTKNIKKYIYMALSIAGIYFVIYGANALMYKNSDGWSNITKRDKARIKLVDRRYDALDYEKYGESLAAIGLSENDAYMILTYQFGDDNVFSFERMVEIGDSFAPKKFGYETFANLFENMVGELSAAATMFAGLIAFIILLLLSIVFGMIKGDPESKKYALFRLGAMVIMGISCAMALVYFQYSGRFSHRITSALVVVTIFQICFMISDLKILGKECTVGKYKTEIGSIIAAMAILVVIFLNMKSYKDNMNDYAWWKEEHEPKLEEINKMAKDKDSYYVIDMFTVQYIHKYSLFEPVAKGFYSNMITSASWYINTPITKVPMEKYGYTNPFNALMDVDGQVYLVDNERVNNKVTFLNEHYDGTYTEEFVAERGKLKIYKIVHTME